eukprot:564229-Lingulodinium_polyedra.AAC.1
MPLHATADAGTDMGTFEAVGTYRLVRSDLVCGLRLQAVRDDELLGVGVDVREEALHRPE